MIPGTVDPRLRGPTLERVPSPYPPTDRTSGTVAGEAVPRALGLLSTLAIGVGTTAEVFVLPGATMAGAV